MEQFRRRYRRDGDVADSMGEKPSSHPLVSMPEDIGRGVGIEEYPHLRLFDRRRGAAAHSSIALRICCSFGWSRSNRNFGSNMSRAAQKSFHGSSFGGFLGVSTTDLPWRRT